jgi:protein phosphatase 1L
MDSSREESPSHYKEPRKKLKGCLQIEIPDSYTEKNEHILNSTSASKSKNFSFFGSKNLLTCKVSTSTPPRLEASSNQKFDFSKFLAETESKYEDFNKEGENYNLSMKKCHRKTMEDRATVEKLNENTTFYGVYDGHRNSYTSEYLQKNLHNLIYENSDFAKNPQQAMKERIYKIDQDVCKNQEKLNLQGGSTALCAVVNAEKMYLANVGDSKAIVIKKTETITINKEHLASDDQEKKIIEERGGFVFEKRNSSGRVRSLVQGSLEISRSIGDRAYKQYISCEPDIYEYQFTDDDEYIIMGSDGFWKEMDEEETLKYIRRYGRSEGLCKYLIEEASSRKNVNVDNITLIVIDLKKLAKAKSFGF